MSVECQISEGSFLNVFFGIHSIHTFDFAFPYLQLYNHNLLEIRAKYFDDLQERSCNSLLHIN